MAIVRRFGCIVKVRPEKLDYYKQLHANPWPEVNAMIKECNLHNFSIYYKNGLLFSYLEYIGDDYELDQNKMAAHLETQEWWRETAPCQMTIEGEPEGTLWVEMEEIYHLD
ncbi:L-rhamnose mutarotase [Yersinia intermedia]|uniref:L-rhamnose mutarotase n=1 Tax=Yersinia intermedia TaxID=631 RepID=UPI000B70BFA0|nr:L-rhamnose mutarotase [Yersinia intermedia]MCW8113874.1 L-rhamnose mutarotase [Yersinia intermedia]MDA5482977.1 L-rhamnose mutarotase [Yersinia intermedia]MDA5518677.1 L-rhamnose mutarotase [Yersinia intermedia]OWF90364.1 L-rhamnose 1-epimerase [Yersinia intermedia]